MNSMPTNLDRVFTGLNPAQADGLACVHCGIDYLTAGVPRRPVGRSETDSQVFACADVCVDALVTIEAERGQETSVMVAVVSWFAKRDKDREWAARRACQDAADRAAAALPTPACPDWCTEGAGHPYKVDYGEEDAIRREHEATVYKTEDGGTGVAIMQDEFYREGSFVLDDPEVYIEWGCADAATVRACGLALVNAAVMLEKIAVVAA
jgi:hypothetical protein